MKVTREAIFKYASPFALLFAGLYFQHLSTDTQSLAFARSGCLVVLFGVIVESFYVIRATSEGATIPKKLTITGGNEPSKSLTLTDYLTMLTTHYGLIWICIGTLVWGYGDMVK